jgi:hypothetical protein
MRVFHVIAVFALLAGPAHAQTLIQSFDSRTPQQKADEELKEKFARESAKKALEANTGTSTSVDAWGNVRSTDAAKIVPSKASAAKNSAAKNSAAKNPKTATSVKPQAKAGSDAN